MEEKNELLEEFEMLIEEIGQSVTENVISGTVIKTLNTLCSQLDVFIKKVPEVSNDWIEISKHSKEVLRSFDHEKNEFEKGLLNIQEAVKKQKQEYEAVSGSLHDTLNSVYGEFKNLSNTVIEDWDNSIKNIECNLYNAAENMKKQQGEVIARAYRKQTECFSKVLDEYEQELVRNTKNLQQSIGKVTVLVDKNLSQNQKFFTESKAGQNQLTQVVTDVQKKHVHLLKKMDETVLYLNKISTGLVEQKGVVINCRKNLQDEIEKKFLFLKETNSRLFNQQIEFEKKSRRNEYIVYGLLVANSLMLISIIVYLFTGTGI